MYVSHSPKQYALTPRVESSLMDGVDYRPRQSSIREKLKKRKLDLEEATKDDIQVQDTKDESSIFKLSDCNEVNLDTLLSLPSIRERECKKIGEELFGLLSRPTFKEKALLDRFRSADGGQSVQEFCIHGTMLECSKVSDLHRLPDKKCDKLHFKKIIQKHTDESLGDCSFLNTCFHMDSCKYVHYEVDFSTLRPRGKAFNPIETTSNALSNHSKHSFNIDKIGTHSILAGSLESPGLYPSQWIQSDLRFFDVSILGKFSVIMADPPWDIHMVSCVVSHDVVEHFVDRLCLLSFSRNYHMEL